MAAGSVTSFRSTESQQMCAAASAPSCCTYQDGPSTLRRSHYCGMSGTPTWGVPLLLLLLLLRSCEAVHDEL
jgi:hypothetical protein